MGRLFHVDGSLVPAGEASVDVRDRGFRYGDAGFETLRLYDGEPFAWSAHADRLARTLRTLGFERAMPPATDLRDRVLETAGANDLAEGWARLSITRGVQPGKLTPSARVDPTVVVTVGELPRGGVGGRPVWDGPATVRTAATRKPDRDAVPPAAKTHNYLGGVLARLEGRDEPTGEDGRGADEALLLDSDGYLTEGTVSNLFFVRDGTLRTPSTTRPILPGVTRSIVLDLAREEGFPTETGGYRPHELVDAEEVFLTNTTWEVRPVESVDGTAYESGPITRLLRRLFDEHVEATHYE